MGALTRVRPARAWADRLDDLTVDGRLHLLCPAGIGDLLWILAKWKTVADQRPTVFHLPAGEQRRAAEYGRLFGIETSYLDGLMTGWVWEQPWEPVLPAGPGWISVQANRHLEAGKRIEGWCPGLPYAPPRPHVACHDTHQRPYVLVFTCHRGYMGGQLKLQAWGEMLRTVERELAPIRFIGAGNDVPFVRELLPYLRHPDTRHLLDRSIEHVLAAARGALCAFGVAGGPLIAALHEGCPTLFGYPPHLDRMPGSWEPPGSRWGWCFTRELPNLIRYQGLQKLLSGEPVGREIAGPAPEPEPEPVGCPELGVGCSVLDVEPEPEPELRPVRIRRLGARVLP